MKRITIQKLAEDRGINPTSIYSMIKKGLLSTYKIPNFARVFIDEDEFEKLFIKENTKIKENDFDLGFLEV